MHPAYLRAAVRRTTLALVGFQAAAAGSWWTWQVWQVTDRTAWTLLCAAQLLGAGVLAVSTARRLRRTAWPRTASTFADAELPTLSVAIPARNETEDLQACLESLVQSTYPKLEILVLDDCSQTRRTPEIIRSFAHDGVRFVEGTPPKPGWLPKNQAYDQLLRESSGEYVLFSGVDARFTPDSLRQLVTTLLDKRKLMMSILPWRAEGAERRLAVVQAMRYLWELAPPRRLFRRPPVLSTCWIARKDELARAGGFVAVARAIVPEAHFAKALAKQNDGYSFMRANEHVGIESTKPAKEQFDTAVRMRYPQLHRRPESVLLLALAYDLFLLVPFIVVTAGPWLAAGVFARTLAAAAVTLLTVTYLSVALVTRTGSPWAGLMALPVGLAYDLILLHISMWKYEFSVVDWKGRNVCIPAMHVIPHLPKL